MRCSSVLIFFIFALPFISHAAEAGFPAQTIWVSNSSAAEGETVVVSAVVYNGKSETLRGTLVFLAGEVRIGAREFEIPGSESQVHSVEWKPKEGAYELSARIEGTSAALSQSETPKLSATILPPPAPTAGERAVAQATEIVSTIASTSAPIISEASQTFFTHTENLREAGVEKIEQYLESRGARGEVAGTSTRASTPSTTATGAPGNSELVSKLTNAAAHAALLVMRNVILFYPALALAFLGILYALARGVRRP